MPPHEDAQVTGMLAVNCCVCPLGVEAADGVMIIGDVTAMTAETAAPP
jgi:hypothetical protein